MKNIIVLTKKFPFDNGEEFLENEDSVMSKKCNVFYIATSVKDNKCQTRKIKNPNFAFGIKEIQNQTLRLLVYSLLGIFEIIKSDVRNEIKRQKGVKNKLAVLYFSAKTTRQCKKILQIKEIYNLLKNDSNVIIYCYWFSDLPYTALKLKNIFIRNDKLKIISRTHRYDLYDYANPIGEFPFRKYIIENINNVFPCSIDGEKYLKEKYPQFSDKFSVSYLGTKDYGMPDVASEEKSFTMVTCSNIIPVKRLDLLVKTLEFIESSNGISNIKWICIGDGELFGDIKAMTKEKLKKTNVQFMGRLKNTEIMKLYKSTKIDLFVNLSESEGLPVSIMEAISFGIPCIATNVGGTSEIVIDNITGKLLDENPSIYEIANGIVSIANNPLSHNGVREFWLDNFCAENNYIKFFNDICFE